MTARIVDALDRAVPAVATFCMWTLAMLYMTRCQ